MSEQPQRKAESGAGVASYKVEEVWSRDASLQQTSVLGPVDGCGMKPEGNANKIQGVVTDWYKGRSGSSGSSLSSMSPLQSIGGTCSTSVLPQTSTHSQLEKKPLSSQVACSPPEENTFEGRYSCGEMDESGGWEESLDMCVTETAGAAVQSSGLGSLANRVSWIVQDAGRHLWSSATVSQQVKEEGEKLPVGAHWSSQVISLVRESKVLSVVKDSQVFSLVKRSYVFSLFKDSHIFSILKDLPLIQQIQTEINQHLQAEETTARIIQGCISPLTTQLPVLSPTQNFIEAEEMPDDMRLIPEDIWTMNMSIGDLQLPQEQDVADINIKKGDKTVAKKHTCEPEVTHLPVQTMPDNGQALENSVTVQNKNDIQILSLSLIEFPDALVNLKNLPLPDLVASLQSVISTSVLSSQKIVALFWLNVAKCSQPEPYPALLILMETGLYTLTSDSGLLVLFHYLPLLQLKEVQIGLAGHSLRLMGSTEESILGLYTHNQELTKELCWAILGVICPGDSRVSQHPLLCRDLVKLSLDGQAYLPDLLLDAGLRVCCQFQKSLADLVYLLYCNMDQQPVALGEVQLLLYTSVGVCVGSGSHTAPLAQLLLTDTHLGLVQEDIVFHPTPRSVTIETCRSQFHNLTLRQRSDVRCVLVHDEDKHGAVTLDVILANVRARGHPESAAILPTHASNSSPHAEVWKLTFSCSTEATCLINHLSNV